MFLVVNLGYASNQSSTTFLFCLKSEIQPFPLELNRGKVQIQEIQEVFSNYNIIKIEPWIFGATENDRDGEIFLNRIYRAYLPQNDGVIINSIINDMMELSSIFYAEPEFIHKLFYYLHYIIS